LLLTLEILTSHYTYYLPYTHTRTNNIRNNLSKQIMGFKHNILLAGALALSVLAAPVPDCPEEHTTNKGKTLVTEANIIAIDPTTASCSGASFPEECADAKTAAAALNSSFEKYNITSIGEVSALVAYTLFESGSYKYKQNHFPGRPGQGTRMSKSSRPQKGIAY